MTCKLLLVVRQRGKEPEAVGVHNSVEGLVTPLARPPTGFEIGV